MSIASFVTSVTSGLSTNAPQAHYVRVSNRGPISSLDPDRGLTFVTEQSVLSPILEILDAAEKGEDFGVDKEMTRPKRQTTNDRPVNIFGLGFGTGARPLPLPAPGGNGQGLIGEQTATDNKSEQNSKPNRPVSNEAANFGAEDLMKLADSKKP